MDKIEKLLKECLFEQKEHVAENDNIDGSSLKYWVQDKYENSMDNRIVWINYGFEYNEDGENIITDLLIIVEYADLRLDFKTLEELAEFFDAIKLHKKTAVHSQKQNIQFAKEEFKLALRNIRFSIIDYIVAKFRILRIRLRRK